jgi:hypothetical protein
MPGSNQFETYLYNPDDTYYSAFSFMIGAFAQIPIDECFSFHPEILYSFIQGDETKISGMKNKDIFGKTIVIRESLQLPMVFRYNFNYTKGNFIPYIDLGLLLDIKIGGKGEIISKSLFPNELSAREYLLANSKVSPLQYGIVVGAGIEYKINAKHSFYPGLRYKYVRGEGLDETTEKLNYFSVNLAYSF